MATENKKTVQKAVLNVDVPKNLRGGTYSNTVNIAVTDSEVTINFINVNQTDEPNGTLVSRVIVSPKFAEALSKAINQSLEKHNKRGAK